MNVFRITQPEGALDNALLDVQAIVRIVQEERRVPDIAMLELVLDELQAVESDFTVNLAALKNPASSQVPGELEAYLELKRDLQVVVEEVRLTKDVWAVFARNWGNES